MFVNKRMIFFIILLFCSEKLSFTMQNNDEQSLKKTCKMLCSFMVPDKTKSLQQVSDQEKKEFVRLRRRLIEFGFSLYDELKRKGDAFDVVDDPSKRKQIFCALHTFAQKDQDITIFTKNIVKFLVKIVIVFTNESLKSPYFNKFQTADITQEEMLLLLQDYTPRSTSYTHDFMKYMVWAYNYTHRLVNIKSYLRSYIGGQDYEAIQNMWISHYCYVLKKLEKHLQFPDRTTALWGELIKYVELGLYALPQDMKKIILESFEQMIEDKLLGSFIDVINSSLKVKNILQEDNEDDDKDWDKFVELWLKKVRKNESINNGCSKYKIIEKMIFSVIE